MSSLELDAVLHELAQRYAATARKVLGERLVARALYGSVARGQAHPASDIDVFVVVRDAPSGMLPRRALLEPVREELTPQLENLWAQGVHTDFAEVIRTPDEALEFHPICLDMALEAERFYDPQGFLEEISRRVRERLAALDARRRQLGMYSCWDLKPGLVPGEVIEL